MQTHEMAKPMVLDSNSNVREIVVEESLSLQDKEKEMIIKALKNTVAEERMLQKI